MRRARKPGRVAERRASDRELVTKGRVKDVRARMSAEVLEDVRRCIEALDELHKVQAKKRARRPSSDVAQMQLVPRLRAIDSFAGGGGASSGIVAAGLELLYAINHSAEALAIHEANHPSTRHACESVWTFPPVPGLDLFWLSPDCTHHSKLKNGKPRSKKIRALAWLAVRWARAARPRLIVCENVEEFRKWGPLDAKGNPIKSKAGLTFKRWVGCLRACGYSVDVRELRACDYGAPTSRKRLFVVARLDGQPVAWPTPSHGPGREHPFRTAGECIDWSVPCPSIFGRSKPYSLPTQRRIAHGLRTYGSPTLIQRGQGERKGQTPRVFDLEKPMTTVVAGGVKHAVVVAFVAKHYGGKCGPGIPLYRPLGAITTRDHHALVVGFKTTSEARKAECRAWLDEHVGVGMLPEVEDIGMRYLTPRELCRAQGFPENYVLDPIVNGKRLTRTKQIRAIGNSVCPQVAEAIVRANISPPKAIAA